MHDPVGATLDRVLDRPSLCAALDDVHAHAERVIDDVDPDLLDLCRSRIALLIGLDAPTATRPTAHPTSDRQRACVDVVEQMVLDVTGVTDEQVATLAGHLGPDRAASFIHAVLAIEQRLRMHALWQHLGMSGSA